MHPVPRQSVQGRPDGFVLYEQYVDEAAFEAHRQSPHFREYIEGGVVPLLAEREWHRYDLVGPYFVSARCSVDLRWPL